MGCVIALLGLIMPRFVIICLAIFTEYMAVAYETTIWPILGWIFMPFTTLAYCAAMINNDHQITGGWIVLMIVTVLMDLGSNGSSTSSSTSSCTTQRES